MTVATGENRWEAGSLSHRRQVPTLTGYSQTEQDADTLAECDRLALERFQMLDAME
jgi:hypothetical protein